MECGACHDPLNPSLLPVSSWAGLMTSLGEHFGEDASLDGPTTRHLAAWLVDNAAETFDTESANRFRVVAPDEPYRASSTPYWVHKHARIPPEVFARRSVQSKVNCHACHRDAERGASTTKSSRSLRSTGHERLAHDDGFVCRPQSAGR